MTKESTGVSDEPTRIVDIIGRFVAGQSGSLLATADAVGADVRLQVGSDRSDDCAVYRLGNDLALVAGSDYVRGVGFSLFELGHLSLHDIGYYLVAANVSDVVSMGATPIGLLTVIRYPKSMSDAEFQEIVAGIHSACSDFGTLNVGGDIGGAEKVILSGTALGVCRPEDVLLRSTARPGNLVAITGHTGLAGAAMTYFTKKDQKGWNLPSEIEERLLAAWRRPRAQVEAGRVLGSKRLATACQDSSDGLKATLEQMAEASGVQVIVDEALVPIHDAVAAVASEAQLDPLGLALSNSVDFQLVFTLEASQLEELSVAFESHGLHFHVIGEVAAASDSGALLRRGDILEPLPGVAWRHQSEESSDIASGILEGLGVDGDSEE